VNSTETIQTAVRNYKSKICLLGGQEQFKDYFQLYRSCASLALQNKANIGVNISRINYQYNSHSNFLYYLWNINCEEQWASYRTSFYSGTEAVIVTISEYNIEQILDYFHEIQSRLSIITMVFCIILEEHTPEEIEEIFHSDSLFDSFLNENNVSIQNISNGEDIFNQLAASYIHRREQGNNFDNYIINFIHVNNLFPDNPIKDICHEYYAPKNEPLNILKNQRIKIEFLREYLVSLGLELKKPDSEWLYFKNPTYGTFSIFLRNGRLYLHPAICELCKLKYKKKCSKFQRAPHFICIEAKNEGWTNISGLDQPELLVISKIFALQQNRLPKEVKKQIQKINTCIR